MKNPTGQEIDALATPASTAGKQIGRRSALAGRHALLIAFGLMVGSLAAQTPVGPVLSTMVDQVNNQLILYYQPALPNGASVQYQYLYQIVWPYGANSFSKVAFPIAPSGGIATYSNKYTVQAGAPKVDAPELYFLGGTYGEFDHVIGAKIGIGPFTCGNIAVPQGDVWDFSSCSGAITATPGSVPATTPGSSLAAFLDPCANSDNIVYIGSDQHVILISRPLSGAIGNNLVTITDLTSQYATPSALGNELTAHVSTPSATVNSQEIFYVDTNHHIRELWRWSGCANGPGFDGWHTTDVNEANGNYASSAAANSPVAGFFDPHFNVDFVFYVDVNQDVHELQFVAAPQPPSFRGQINSWSNLNITTNTGAPNPVAGTQLAAHQDTINDADEVFWVDGSGSVWMSEPSAIAGQWQSTPIGSNVGAPPAALSSPLVTDINPFYSTDELYYIGSDQHIHEIWFDGWWNLTDVTSLSGAPVAVP